MQMIIMKAILIITLIIGMVLIFRKKEKYNLILNAFFWIFISWITCLMLYFFSGIKYTHNLDILSFGYIFILFGFFCEGYYVSKFIKNKKKKNKHCDNKNINFTKKINLLPLFIISVICVLIYSAYIIITNNITVGVTREIATNSFTTLMLLISSSSLVVWLYELGYALLNDKRVSFYGIVSMLVFNLPGIIISGRDALIIFLFSTFILYIYCGNYSKKVLKKEGKTYKRIKIYALFAFIAILVYLFLLSNNRYGTTEDAALDMFEWSAGCEFPEYLLNLHKNTGSVGNLVNNIVFYYSSQISKYAFVFNNYDGPHMFGLYQLHYISRLLPDSWNLNYTRVSQQLAELTNNAGTPGLKVLWETAIGYSIYDFGRIGTAFVSFISGIAIGLISRWCNDNKNIIKILIKVFVCLAMFMTVEISPFFDYFYIFPLFWIIIIYLISTLKINKGKRVKEVKRNEEE